MNDWRQVERDAQRAVQRILTEVGVERVESLRPGQCVRPLAGFSAAWRLAPEVRYRVAAVYEKWLVPEFSEATERIREIQNAAV